MQHRRLPGLVVGLLGLVALAGCGTSTPYYLIESRLVQSSRHLGSPDVTETPVFRGMRGGVRTLGLQPPDVCADRGLSRSSGGGDPQIGVLRTRCGVEMAELERALARAGYRVVSWGAIHHLATRQEKPVLEAASELDVDVLLQVNALERVELQPGRDARFERRFYRARRSGERTEPARVTPVRRSEFEALVAPREARLVTGKRVGATINVSAIQVATGAALWFYEWTRVDEVASQPLVEVLADCDAFPFPNYGGMP
ncbi:MAG TPA: hypothetical protein PLW10_25970, partial [Myxococcota bacterium]|nr:hypothetical protein [Myxococcota bacterium]